MLLVIIFAITFMVNLPAIARPDQVIIINKTNSQDVRQYNYSVLNESFASYKGDKSQAGLYLDFYSKIKVGGGYKVYALHDDTSKSYLDYSTANDAFAMIKGKNIEGTDTVKFNLGKYTSKTDPRFPDPVLATMPATVTKLISNIDASQAPTSELVFTPDTQPVLDAPLSNVTIEGIVPVVTGTPDKPVLTFYLESTGVYSKGTADLSEDIAYTIHYHKHDISGTAKVGEDLMNTALGLLAFYDDGSTSITGANLFKNSPLSITVTGSTRSADYIVYFSATP